MIMDTRTRRVLVLVLAGAVLVTCVAGLASAQDALPSQPVMTIRTISDGEEHEGALAEYCWPSAAAGVACGTTTERPESTIVVENGDIIAIVIEGDAGPPSQLAITFPEVLDRRGRALQVSLDTPGDATEWVVDLAEGEHEAVIDAVFAAVTGAAGFTR